MKAPIFLLLLTIGLYGMAQTATPTLDWGFQSGSSNSDDLVNEINITPQNNILLTGSCSGVIDLDFGPGLFEVGTWGEGTSYFAEYDTSGALNWEVHYIGFTGFLTDVELDPLGNIFAVGVVYSDNNNAPDTIDFDPGTGVFDLEVQDVSQFLLKLDAQGNFIDAKITASSTANGFQLRSESMHLDDNLNIYVGGFYVGEFDLNPGGIPNLINSGSTPNGFIEKFDSNGNLLWMHEYDNSWVYDVKVDNNNDLLVGGYFKDSIDFDFGPGIDLHIVDALDSTASFIQKVDAGGNSVWSESFSHGTWNHVSDIVTDDNGDIYLSSIGGLYLNGGNLILQRLNGNGTQLWDRLIGNPQGSQIFGTTKGMKLDSLNNVYISGTYLGEVDFDPNPYTEYMDTSSANLGDNFLLKLSSGGSFIWEFDLGTYAMNVGMQDQFQLDADNNVYVFSNFEETVDIEPGAGVTNLTSSFNSADVYFIRYSQGPCANIFTEVDTAYNWSCYGPGWIATTTYAGTTPYAYFWNSTPPSDSANVVATSSGVYELEVTDALGCTTEKAILINGPSVVNGYDLNINAITGYPVIGDTIHFWLDAFNDGCVPQDGEISFVVPSQIQTLVNITPAPSMTVGDTLYWDFPTSIYGDPHYLIDIYASIDTLAIPGDTMCFDIAIMPDSTDSFPLNNSKTYCKELLASYDPNFKEVYPLGACEEHFVETGQTLTYTVHFQNTGTFQAFNIRVRDVLDPNMDVNSLRVLAQSHPMYINVIGNNTVDFRFDNINLPDSASNEAASHGWFVFDVDPLPGLPNNTLVQNNVNIYFDYNDPILTNAVFNTYIDVIPSCFLGLNDPTEDDFLVYPNPSSGIFQIALSTDVSNVVFTVFTLDGKQVTKVLHQSGHQFELDLSDQPEGLYWLEISGDMNATKKLLRK